MYLSNYTNDSLTFSSTYIIKRSTVNRRSNISTQEKWQRTNRTVLLWSNNSTGSFANLSTQPQKSPYDEPYSVKTGIRIAALLGGMLVFCVVYVLWKARKRICCCLSPPSLSECEDDNSHKESSRFDLDYWLKQVDLLEAREAECNRAVLLPYLQLPTEEPRNSQVATASWITDACRHWQFFRYRQQLELLQHPTTEHSASDPTPYRRRRRMLRRALRRIITRPDKHLLNIDPNIAAIITDLRSNVVETNIVLPIETIDLQPRRVASWPRLKSHNDQNDATITGLQARNARKHLLKRIKKPNTLDKYEEKT